MQYEAKVILGSVNQSGNKLYTVQVTYPRFIHSEFLVHRMMSRSSASSRAIPISKMIKQVEDSPVLPIYWGKNQSGMQAQEELDEADIFTAKNVWLEARDNAIESVKALNSIGLHKQLTNRILEPFSWITVIITATEWSNFFNLRCHPDAQPEIRLIAEMIREAISSYKCNLVEDHAWHLPYIQDDEQNYDITLLKKISVARCARVSYLNHEGIIDIDKDLALFSRLVDRDPKHLGPLEAVATPSINLPVYAGRYASNFHGWWQYRHLLNTREDYT